MQIESLLQKLKECLLEEKAIRFFPVYLCNEKKCDCVVGHTNTTFDKKSNFTTKR